MKFTGNIKLNFLRLTRFRHAPCSTFNIMAIRLFGNGGTQDPTSNYIDQF